MTEQGGSRKAVGDAGTGSATRDREKEEAVLRAVQAGEPGAFDRFVELFGQRLFAFGVRMCGHREDAEDVFQETLISIFRKLGSLREPGALTTWMYRIVANACLTSRRRSKFAPKQELSLEELLPRGGVVESGPVLPEASGPDADLYRKELSQELDKVVRDLPPDYRVVWLMRDVEGLDTAETAEALQISVPNAKMRLHRARLYLRKRLAHLDPTGASS